MKYKCKGPRCAQYGRCLKQAHDQLGPVGAMKYVEPRPGEAVAREDSPDCPRWSLDAALAGLEVETSAVG